MYKAFGLEGIHYSPPFDGGAVSRVVNVGDEIEMVPLEPNWAAEMQALGSPDEYLASLDKLGEDMDAVNARAEAEGWGDEPGYADDVYGDDPYQIDPPPEQPEQVYRKTVDLDEAADDWGLQDNPDQMEELYGDEKWAEPELGGIEEPAPAEVPGGQVWEAPQENFGLMDNPELGNLEPLDLAGDLGDVVMDVEQGASELVGGVAEAGDIVAVAGEIGGELGIDAAAIGLGEIAGFAGMGLMMVGQLLLAIYEMNYREHWKKTHTGDEGDSLHHMVGYAGYILIGSIFYPAEIVDWTLGTNERTDVPAGPFTGSSKFIFTEDPKTRKFVVEYKDLTQYKRRIVCPQNYFVLYKTLRKDGKSKEVWKFHTIPSWSEEQKRAFRPYTVNEAGEVHKIDYYTVLPVNAPVYIAKLDLFKGKPIGPGTVYRAPVPRNYQAYDRARGGLPADFKPLKVWPKDTQYLVSRKYIQESSGYPDYKVTYKINPDVNERGSYSITELMVGKIPASRRRRPEHDWDFVQNPWREGFNVGGVSKRPGKILPDWYEPDQYRKVTKGAPFDPDLMATNIEDVGDLGLYYKKTGKGRKAELDLIRAIGKADREPPKRVEVSMAWGRDEWGDGWWLFQSDPPPGTTGMTRASDLKPGDIWQAWNSFDKNYVASVTTTRSNPPPRNKPGYDENQGPLQTAGTVVVDLNGKTTTFPFPETSNREFVYLTKVEAPEGKVAGASIEPGDWYFSYHYGPVAVTNKEYFENKDGLPKAKLIGKAWRTHMSAVADIFNRHPFDTGAYGDFVRKAKPVQLSAAWSKTASWQGAEGHGWQGLATREVWVPDILAEGLSDREKDHLIEVLSGHKDKPTEIEDPAPRLGAESYKPGKTSTSDEGGTTTFHWGQTKAGSSSTVEPEPRPDLKGDLQRRIHASQVDFFDHLKVGEYIADTTAGYLFVYKVTARSGETVSVVNPKGQTLDLNRYQIVAGFRYAEPDEIGDFTQVLQVAKEKIVPTPKIEIPAVEQFWESTQVGDVIYRPGSSWYHLVIGKDRTDDDKPALITVAQPDYEPVTIKLEGMYLARANEQQRKAFSDGYNFWKADQDTRDEMIREAAARQLVADAAKRRAAKQAALTARDPKTGVLPDPRVGPLDIKGGGLKDVMDAKRRRDAKQAALTARDPKTGVLPDPRVGPLDIKGGGLKDLLLAYHRQTGPEGPGQLAAFDTTPARRRLAMEPGLVTLPFQAWPIDQRWDWLASITKFEVFWRKLGFSSAARAEKLELEDAEGNPLLTTRGRNIGGRKTLNLSQVILNYTRNEKARPWRAFVARLNPDDTHDRVGRGQAWEPTGPPGEIRYDPRQSGIPEAPDEPIARANWLVDVQNYKHEWTFDANNIAAWVRAAWEDTGIPEELRINLRYFLVPADDMPLIREPKDVSKEDLEARREELEQFVELFMASSGDDRATVISRNDDIETELETIETALDEEDFLAGLPVEEIPGDPAGEFVQDNAPAVAGQPYVPVGRMPDNNNFPDAYYNCYLCKYGVYHLGPFTKHLKTYKHKAAIALAEVGGAKVVKVKNQAGPQKKGYDVKEERVEAPVQAGSYQLAKSSGTWPDGKWKCHFCHYGIDHKTSWKWHLKSTVHKRNVVLAEAITGRPVLSEPNVRGSGYQLKEDASSPEHSPSPPQPDPSSPEHSPSPPQPDPPIEFLMEPPESDQEEFEGDWGTGSELESEVEEGPRLAWWEAVNDARRVENVKALLRDHVDYMLEQQAEKQSEDDFFINFLRMDWREMVDPGQTHLNELFPDHQRELQDYWEHISESMRVQTTRYEILNREYRRISQVLVSIDRTDARELLSDIMANYRNFNAAALSDRKEDFAKVLIRLYGKAASFESSAFSLMQQSLDDRRSRHFQEDGDSEIHIASPPRKRRRKRPKRPMEAADLEDVDIVFVPREPEPDPPEPDPPEPDPPATDYGKFYGPAFTVAVLVLVAWALRSSESERAVGRARWQ